MKVPQNEVVVALGRSEAAVARQASTLNRIRQSTSSARSSMPGKTILPTQLLDRSGRRQRGDGGRNLRIADPEQRARARRFQHHLVAAPSHVGKPRQDEDVGIAEPRRCRPVVGNLRLDDDRLVVAVAPRRYSNRPCPANRRTSRSISLSMLPTAGRKRSERQASAQILRAIRGGRAECSQADRIAIEEGDDLFRPRALRA